MLTNGNKQILNVAIQGNPILSYHILQNSLKTLLFFILTKILLYPIMWTSPPFTSYTPIFYHFLYLTHIYITTFYILHTYFLPPFTSYTPIPYHLLYYIINILTTFYVKYYFLYYFINKH